MGCSPSRAQHQSNVAEIIPTKAPEYLLRSADVKHSLGIHVEVKGVCDAIIYLCGPQEEADYEVAIGCQGNSLCRLQSSRDANSLAQCQSMAILDQSGYRGFWLAWRSGQLALGRGYRPGQQEMLRLPVAVDKAAPASAGGGEGAGAGTDGGYRPYCVKVACPTPGGRVCFRSARLLFEDEL